MRETTAAEGDRAIANVIVDGQMLVVKYSQSRKQV
jgi:hypothetical protein